MLRRYSISLVFFYNIIKYEKIILEIYCLKYIFFLIFLRTKNNLKEHHHHIHDYPHFLYFSRLHKCTHQKLLLLGPKPANLSPIRFSPTWITIILCFLFLTIIFRNFNFLGLCLSKLVSLFFCYNFQFYKDYRGVIIFISF